MNKYLGFLKEYVNNPFKHIYVKEFNIIRSIHFNPYILHP